MGLPINDADAEDFIVSIHTGTPNAKDLISEFQRINGSVRVAVSIEMLSTGIDAPDIEVLLMARPTKSKVLYAQMKGRGARKCIETGKDKFILIDFVDAWSIEEQIITNEILVAEEESQYEEIPDSEEIFIMQESKEGYKTKSKEIKHREIKILDIPVWVVYSEVIEPKIIDEIGKQIQDQLKTTGGRILLKERFQQALIAWQYFKGKEKVDERYLKAMGFDLETLRDIYGEPQANLQDFIEVALGKKSFLTSEERKKEDIKRWLKEEKEISDEGIEFIFIYLDFKKRNPELTLSQFMKSRIVDLKGGLPKIEELFGDIKKFKDIAEDTYRRYIHGG